MNREIKFRGQRVDGEGWVFGFLVIDPKGNYRIYFHPFSEATSNTFFLVEPNTVGQFTGLKDKNGVDIYEGDIVNFHYFYEDFIDMGAVEAEKEITAIVEMREFGLFLNNGNEYESAHAIFYNPHEESFEVIGSIHSNPEILLK